MRTRIALAITMFTVALAALIATPVQSSGVAPALPPMTTKAPTPSPTLHRSMLMVGLERHAVTTTTVAPTTTTTVQPVAVQTTVQPAPVPTTAPVPAPASVAVAAPSGSTIWDCIIAHESGGNPSAVNPSSGAGGLFQFLPSSWLAYGGGQFAPLPEEASAADQWVIAEAAQARSGWYPWVGDGCTPVG